MDSLLLEADAIEADALKDGAAQRDCEALQGAWGFVSGIREVQLLFVGDHFTARFADGDIYVGTFRVDPTRKPRAIDMIITEGPARHKGKTSLGIYELTGDQLIWCPAEPGLADRLAAFPAANDTRRLCVVFRHEGPRRSPR